MNKYTVAYSAEIDGRWTCTAESSQAAVDMLRALHGEDDVDLEIKAVYLLVDMKGEWK